MQVFLTIILTGVLLYFYADFLRGLADDDNYLVLLVCAALPFAYAYFFSTDWEREHDLKNYYAWKQKWRCRFSRIWPARGEVIPPEKRQPKLSSQ